MGSFSNATDAVQQLPALSPDVVLMDIHLSPTESGIDVFRDIKSQCLGSQFLMFTVFDNDAAVFDYYLQRSCRGIEFDDKHRQAILSFDL